MAAICFGSAPNVDFSHTTRKKRKLKKFSQKRVVWSARTFMIAYRARRCSTHRLKRAKLKHTRLAQKLRSRWSCRGRFAKHAPWKDSFVSGSEGLLPTFPFPTEDFSDPVSARTERPPASDIPAWIHSDMLQGGVSHRYKRKHPSKNTTSVPNALIRSLISGLKSCLSQGTLPTELVSVLAESGLSISPTADSSPPNKKQRKKPPTEQPSEGKHELQVNQTKLSGSRSHAGTETPHWWKCSDGTWKPYYVNKDTGWWRWADNVEKPPSAVSPPKTPPVVPKVQHLYAAEWTQTPNLGSFQAVRDAIHQGTEWKWNMIATSNRTEVQMLVDLYASFDIKQGLTLILSGEAMNWPQSTLSRARIQRLGQTARSKTLVC